MKSYRMLTSRQAVWLAALLLLLGLTALLRPPAAHAANITVAAGEVAIVDNNVCSLREAIANANNEAATFDDCTGGSGADVITLTNSTYNIADIYGPYLFGNNGLPPVTSPITIDGNGATINRTAGTLRLILVTGSGSNLTLNNLSLTNGSMTSDRGGGAIHNNLSTVTLNNVTLSGNSANGSGGGGGAISAEGGTTNVNNSTFTGNSADGGPGGGGISANNGATINVTNSTFSNNTAATTAGGAIRGTYTGTNVINITGSTFNGNSANDGGGVGHGAGSVTITNSTLSGNTASNAGGGIHGANATVTLNNVTITGNTATGTGGGIYSNSTVNYNRSIISGNFANSTFDSGYEVYNWSTDNANNYNVFGRSDITTARAFGGGSFVPGANDVNATSNGATPTSLANILNTTLANNGGPTNTHALVAGSPAVDFAPSADCTAAPINGVDQRGLPRNVDGNASASANECDSGAFEYLSSPPPTTGDIVIIKVADPADDTEFDFTEDIDNVGFTLSDPSDDTETFDDIAPGTYTIIETAETGWTLDDIDCDDPSSNTTEDESGGTAVIDLSAGETVTCTFNNSRDTGTVVIVKAATPEDDTPFDFSHTLDITGTFTLMDPSDNTETFNNVPTGSYTATETGETGWTLDDITCDDANSTDTGSTATINVEKDETVTCTFSNSRDTGTVVIEKAATPEDDTPFDFTHTLDIAGTFTLMDPSDNTETFNDVPTGSYSATETGETGWTLDDITCDDANSTDTGNTATINVEKDETVTCTFSNSRDTGAIVIVKAATPADDTPFSFTEDIPGVGSGFSLSDPSDNTETFNSVPTGSYNVAETVPAPWLLTDIDCDDVNSVESEGTATATVNLEDGETVTCTFYNSNPVAPEPDIFVSAEAAGVTDDAVAFGPHDILQWQDGSGWSKWFDGTTAGLMPSGPNKHDVNAFWIPNPAAPDVVLSFTQNARFVPGITPKVDGMDLVWWDGTTFSLWFDGQDVALTSLTDEKVDAVHVLPGAMAPAPLAAASGGSCLHYLLISTQAGGKVPHYAGGNITFSGEDVLGFCMTQSGPTTAGKWTLVIDGSAQGVPRNSINSLSASDDGLTIYLMTRGTFVVDAAAGGHSMLYEYDVATTTFSGPTFIAANEGLHVRVDALQVEEN